jgi:hypothetical protein
MRFGITCAFLMALCAPCAFSQDAAPPAYPADSGISQQQMNDSMTGGGKRFQDEIKNLPPDQHQQFEKFLNKTQPFPDSNNAPPPGSPDTSGAAPQR